MSPSHDKKTNEKKVLNWLTADSTEKQEERKVYDIGQLFCMSTDRRETERSR
jgi:hypothetical protein